MTNFNRACRAAAVVTALGTAMLPALSMADTLSSEEKSAQERFLASLATDGELHELNFEDPTQYRGYIALLKSQGITAKNRPQLFRVLERQHTAAGRTSELETIRKASARSMEADPTPKPAFQVFNLGTNDGKTFTASALSSIFNGAYSSRVEVILVDAQGKRITSESNEAYGLGGREVVATTPSVSAGTNASEVKVVGLFSGVTTDGVPYSQYRSVLGGYWPKEMVNIDPKKQASGDPSRGIIVCLNRANPEPGAPHKCDYGPMDPGKPNDKVSIKFPFVGRIKYSDKLLLDNAGKPAKGSATLLLVGRQVGGGCGPVDIGNTFFNAMKVSPAGDELSWNLKPADFGKPCYANNTSYTLTLNVNVLVKNGTVAVPVNTTFTNAPGVIPSATTLVLDDLVVQYGCVAEGTMVVMSDGSNKAIETIQQGDLVRGGNGRAYKVAETTLGWDHDFVSLNVKGLAQPVKMTPAHPVPTRTGMVTAETLHPGDVVTIADGKSAAVTAVTHAQESEAVKVYNLKLINPDGTLPNDANDATFIAGNLVVGDAELQRRLSEKPLNLAEQRLRVPREWQEDFDNYTAEQAQKEAAK